jgi:hypothetical protein
VIPLASKGKEKREALQCLGSVSGGHGRLGTL